MRKCQQGILKKYALQHTPQGMDVEGRLSYRFS
jgi:hypothetical protein